MNFEDQQKFSLNKSFYKQALEKIHPYFNRSLLSNLIVYFIYTFFLYQYNKFCFSKYYNNNMSNYQMVTIFTSKVAMIPTVLINIHYWTFYYFQWHWAEKYKSNNVPWPWQLDKQKWRKMRWNSFLTYVFNQLFIFPPIFYLLMHLFAPDNRTETFPDLFTFFLHLYIQIIIEDFCFYWFHRMLHLPFFYKWIHKKHHSHYNTFNLSGVYTHWIEFAFGNIISMLIGMIVLNGKLHVFTLNYYIIVRNLGANDGHSGYQFPWTMPGIFPFSTDSMYHNYHHLVNLGNYGDSFIIWDSIFGTNKDYYDEIKEIKNTKIE